MCALRIKRKAGENPAQSRCCNGGFGSLIPLAKAEKGDCGGRSQKACLYLKCRNIFIYRHAIGFLRRIGKGGNCMNFKKKAGYIPVLAAVLALAVAPTANAMHIMEGFLSPAYCIAWGVISIPFIVLGIRSIKRIIEKDRKTIMLIAMCAAYAFVLSALKIPSVTGSCSHPTGVGLGAIFFWPAGNICFWLYCTFISGDFAWTRRRDNIGRQCIFHGNCRPVCILRDL